MDELMQFSSMVAQWFGNEANNESKKKQRQEKSNITDWCIFLIPLDFLKYISISVNISLVLLFTVESKTIGVNQTGFYSYSVIL